MQRPVGIVALIILTLIITAIWQRHRISLAVIGTGETPPLLEARDEGADVRWFDEYFTVEQLDERTYAIGEPRYLQQNYNYLILGDTRAILFDAGPGVEDIRAVVESLTDLPLTFIPSHFHYDHIGNRITFAHVAVVDLPYLRARAVDNNLRLTWQEHLGSAEGITAPTLEVSEWIKPGETIDLGGRTLQMVYTPGHTEDSISLLDHASGQLFTGDFIYPGPLFAFLPNSSLPDYLQAADQLMELISPNVTLYGAHRSAPPGTPRQTYQDLQDLQRTLSAIKRGDASGTGVYPLIYEVNDSMTLYAEPGWLQRW